MSWLPCSFPVVFLRVGEGGGGVKFGAYKNPIDTREMLCKFSNFSFCFLSYLINYLLIYLFNYILIDLLINLVDYLFKYLFLYLLIELWSNLFIMLFIY